LLSSSLDITARKVIEDGLLRRVNFDDLTGLPNRILIREHVDRILRDKNRRFALAFIDLDNFKHINDYYSHAIGDALLLKIAGRIAKRLRDSDMLARISGDEFLLLLDPIEDNDQIGAIVEQILTDLKQPFHIEAFEVFTSASIGVSVHPEHGLNYEELRRNADSAMYRAKSDAKGDAVYFDLHMGQAITARMELEQRLRLAIRDCRFCCAFQPKVDIRSQEVIGFETLVRWRDDEGEIHPPSSFIGLAIELGLIDTITHFVLAEALRSIESLDQEFGPTTTISVNVAAKQASDLNFMRPFAEILKASKFASRIMLELTEDAFVAKSHFQMQVLPLLREIGVRVSIDDFGTGYSSLSALADITADELKVDRSFISAIHERPRSQSVLRAIESLGHALGMTIVAEGVETFEELAYLQAATRIRHAQGYYFSKPFFLEEAASARRVTFTGQAFSGRAYIGLAYSGRAVEAVREPLDGRGSHSSRAAVAARLRRD
jgi:diguanylate cyclase (GGDEF)-like protein